MPFPITIRAANPVSSALYIVRCVLHGAVSIELLSAVHNVGDSRVRQESQNMYSSVIIALNGKSQRPLLHNAIAILIDRCIFLGLSVASILLDIESGRF